MHLFLRVIIFITVVLGITNVWANEAIKEGLAPETLQKENNLVEETNQETAVLDKDKKISEAASDLSVVDFMLTNKVEGREPKQVVETFDKGSERGYAFARLNVKNNNQVTFIWYRNGKEYSKVDMPVHAAEKWRTYSSVKLQPGSWKVQLVANQEVLAEKTFSVE